MRVTTSSARSGALALQMFDGHAQAVRPVAREPVRVSGEYPWCVRDCPRCERGH